MKRFFLMIILLFIPFFNAFGDSLTIERFISTAEYDSQLKEHNELVAYMKNAPVSTPYIDKIELRTETKEFDIAKQRYSIRFYPRGLGETEYNKIVAETMKKAVTAEHEVIFNTILQYRYSLVLDFLETLSLLNMKKMLLAVYDDQVIVLKKMSLSDLTFDVRNLVSAEERYDDLKFELIDLENRINSVIEGIKRITDYYYSEIIFDEKEIIKPEQIEKAVHEIQSVQNHENILIKCQDVKTELAKYQYDLEKAKEKSYISFISLNYDSDEYDNAEKAFSVEAGFNLPFVISDAEKIISKKKSHIEEKLKYEYEKRASSEKIKSLSASLRQLISKYRNLAILETESDAKISFKKYSEIEGADPLTLLKIKETILKRDIQLNELCWLIRRQYIELIDITGKLSERPLRNYFKP